MNVSNIVKDTDKKFNSTFYGFLYFAIALNKIFGKIVFEFVTFLMFSWILWFTCAIIYVQHIAIYKYEIKML